MNYIKLQKKLRMKHIDTFTDQVNRIFEKVNCKARKQREEQGIILKSTSDHCIADYQYLCE